MAKILEITHVSSPSDSSNSLSEFSLPLTFFGTYLFKYHPVEALLFYSHQQPKQTMLHSTIPKLKHTLSLTLKYFLPLAGKLTWPQDSPNPIFLYTPNDGVSLTVAEANEDPNIFGLLSSNQIREAALFYPLVPKLHVSNIGASVIALQITLFPNKGFCIGVTTHHALLDGKSASMFLKSWAYLSRFENAAGLPPELTPFFDRSVIEDPDGLNMLFLNQWIALSGASNAKDCKNLFELLLVSESSSDLVRGTFELKKTDMSKLKEMVLSKWEKLEPTRPTTTKPHITSFVVTYAYALVCILKATEEDEDRSKKRVFFRIWANFRSRSPSIPETYFGNCVIGLISHDDIREVVKEEEAFAAMALKIGERIREFEEDFKDGSMEKLPRLIPRSSSKDTWFISAAGSPRLGLYDVDFGWGKPKKVEIVSSAPGSIGMQESRDGSGGIEITLALKKNQMDVFSSLFQAGVDQTLENS